MAETAKTSKEDKKPLCFVIMPFSDPEGYEKGHFWKIYKQVFVPAIEMAGYEAYRVDENIESTLIHGKMLNQLVTAPMVLCDLSTKNPNVLYELGIRHAFDLPVVLVQEAEQSHIFDIAGITTIEYRRNRFYDEVVEDQRKISDAIMQTANTKKNYSIMSLAQLEPAKLNKSDKISREDRLEIMIDQLNNKIENLGDQIARVRVNCAPLINTDELTLEKPVWFELRRSMSYGEEILDEYKQNKDRIPISVLRSARNNLADAIKKYERHPQCSMAMVNSAYKLLADIQYALSESKE